MGFNLGSTRVRQLHTGEVQPHVFESPLIRLMKDHDYIDSYRDGEILPRGPIPSRSVWTFRYYDIADEHFGEGERKEIEFHADRLRDFLLHVREAVLDQGEDRQRFRVYLVAHSMGGLIARCYLQRLNVPDLNDKGSSILSRKGVDKLFTYGTPHGGIQFRGGLRFAEAFRDFLDPNNAGNFGPRRMREFLHLPDGQTPLNSLAGRFPPERVFCLVGTNPHDYEAAAGLSRRVVGGSSDGLVKISNASVREAPRAYVHRSHSGPYGLVNSESGYQNLRRFLFGDTRVRVEMSVADVPLPRRLQREKDAGKQIRASYHIDTVFSIRGVPVELNRRVYDEGSAIFRTYDQLRRGRTTLFTAFLMSNARLDDSRASLGFGLRLVVRVPRYEVDGFSFLDDHYEGGTLFSDKLNVEVTPRRDGGSRIGFGWDSRTPNHAPRSMQIDRTNDGALVGTIPFGRPRARPGIFGSIHFTITPWNVE